MTKKAKLSRKPAGRLGPVSDLLKRGGAHVEKPNKGARGEKTQRAIADSEEV